ncbi:InlB B-repeat-containing protein, partial [Butyrivibrio sp. MC2021]|uniref:InlB B-repeat-containing protein n=1 Tax=Butyrivibrio sp. MC2021 TaxID=1408306 RepID=UPI00047CB245
KITGSEATPKAGYVFEGWYKDDEKVADTAQISAATVYSLLNTREKDGLPADTTFEARFVIDVNDTYKISYVSAGNGSVNPEEEIHQVLDTQDKIAGSEAKADAGYKFDGWYKDGEKIANAGETISAAFVYANLNTREKDGLPADTTFEARFVTDDEDTYKISYTTDGNGSANPEDETHQVLDTQDKIGGSEAKANAGYVFEGWYKGEEKVADTATISAEVVYANLNTRAKDGLHDDTTFEARFVLDVNDTYKVEYKTDGNGTATPAEESHQVLDTASITGSKAEANPGYVFDGWYKGDEKIAGAGETIAPAFVIDNLDKREDGLPAKVTTFTARFKLDENAKFTVTYLTDGNGTATPGEETHQALVTVSDITGSLAKAKEGYKFEGWYKGDTKIAGATEQFSPGLVYANLEKKANGLPDNTTFTAKFEKDESQQKEIVYTVNHVVDGEIKATDKFTFKVWVGDPDTVKVTAASIKPNEYEGYEYTKTVNADGGAEIKADDEVENKTVINVIYDPVTVTIRYEYRPGPGVTLPSDLPELPAAYEAQFGDIINVPDVPTYKGYSFTDWEMEKDETDTGILSFISEIFGTVYKFMAGLGREQVGASTMVAPAYDVVIYTIVTKNATPTPPGPTPDDPTPTPPTPPTPTPDPAPADPTPTPAAPVAATPAAGQAVLGATRDDTTGNGRAVLGARRGRTDDETNSSARVFAILVSAAVAISLFFTGKKKEEEEK